MINKTEIKCRFRRSIESYEDNATVQKLIVNRLLVLLDRYAGDPVSILEIGCGTGFLSEKIIGKWFDKNLYINDLVEEMCSKTASKCQLQSSHCLTGDIESLELPGKFDLMVSASTFQWLADPTRTFVKLAGYLNPEGHLIFSTFGEDNFKEVKAVTGNGLVYHPMSEMVKLLQTHFDVLYTEEERHTLEFDEPLEILQHIKKTGVNASPISRGWTRGDLKQFSEVYTSHFLTDGKCPLTYHPLYLVCRKKL